MLSPAVLVAITERAAGRKVNIAALCREENISTSWFYEQLGRFTKGGLEALTPHSTAPHTRPSTTPPGVVEAIVRARKDLHDEGSDNGPFYIRQRLIADAETIIPSESTIYRHLKQRGQILAQPNKRPHAYRRFEFPAPNACWQIDGTHIYLANGTRVTVVEIIDDHSRVCIASHAAVSESFESAWAALQSGFEEYRYPTMILSDNGTAFSGRRRGTISELERELAALGIVAISSSVAHPQTCGKVERHHQTMKKWLAARPAAASLGATADPARRVPPFLQQPAAENTRRRHPHHEVGSDAAGRTPSHSDGGSGDEYSPQFSDRGDQNPRSLDPPRSSMEEPRDRRVLAGRALRGVRRRRTRTRARRRPHPHPATSQPTKIVKCPRCPDTYVSTKS